MRLPLSMLCSLAFSLHCAIGALAGPAPAAPDADSRAVNSWPNPSMEESARGWWSGSGAGGAVGSLERSQAWASAGRASLRLPGSVADRRGSCISALSRPVPVLGGQEYTLRATLNVAKLPAGGRGALLLGWLDSSGAYLPAESMADAAEVAALGVREAQVTKPAPRDAASARVVIGSAGVVPGDYDDPYTQVWPAPDAPINLDPVAPTLDALEQAGVRTLLLRPVTPWMITDKRLDPDQYENTAAWASGPGPTSAWASSAPSAKPSGTRPSRSASRSWDPLRRARCPGSPS